MLARDRTLDVFHTESAELWLVVNRDDVDADPAYRWHLTKALAKQPVGRN